MSPTRLYASFNDFIYTHINRPIFHATSLDWIILVQELVFILETTLSSAEVGSRKQENKSSEFARSWENNILKFLDKWCLVPKFMQRSAGTSEEWHLIYWGGHSHA